MYYLISILFGLIPEVLFLILFVDNIKNFKGKKIKLFMMIGLTYFLCLLIKQYVILYYFLFIIFTYFIFKILYKNETELIDIFIISFATMYLTLVGFVTFLFVDNNLSNYYLMYIVNRFLLFSIFIFKNKIKNFYSKYYKFWNRNDSIKKPFKSITIRNVSLVLINVFVFSINIALNNIINIISKR